MFRFLSAVLTGWAIAGAAVAEIHHLCWIDRVEAVAEGTVRVRLSPGYASTLQKIERQNGREEGRPEPAAVHFDLRAGDVAHLRTAHDTCRLTARVQDGHLGVWAEAVTRVHGLPPVEASAFIPPTDPGLRE